jgi:hypothetical protein
MPNAMPCDVRCQGIAHDASYTMLAGVDTRRADVTARLANETGPTTREASHGRKSDVDLG